MTPADLAAMHAMDLRRKLYDTYNLLRHRSKEERKAIEKHLRKYEADLLKINP